uniref:Uncharacterized protein n=1 Tax=Leptobrachium leishanense TaxID=445787 RepID=A0A8C5PU73_9ANUR
MVGEDEENLPINPSDPDKHKATDMENERKEDGMDTNDTTGEPGNPTPQNDMSAGRARHDDMETEPPEPGDTAKYGTGLGGKNPEPGDTAKHGTGLGGKNPEPGDTAKHGTGLGGKNPEPGGDSAQRDRHENVGIFITDLDVDVHCLMNYINPLSESCNANIVPLTHDSWVDVADKTSPHIICHSVRSRTPLSDLERHREYFTQSHVPVKVLITDVSDPELEKQIRRWMEQHMLRTWELVILYENEIDSIQPERQKPCTDTNQPERQKPCTDTNQPERQKPCTDTNQPERQKPCRDTKQPERQKPCTDTNQPERQKPCTDTNQPERQKPCTDTNTEDKLKRMREILSTAAPSQFHGNKERRKDHTIGIFSRSAEEDYLWLQTLLRSDIFSHCVQEVRPCYISSSGFRQFRQDVSQCSFGILYHTKNRGRVNVTDVTSALYNDELRYLSDTRGRENVLVVIDDLDDSGPDMRSRILQTQPSIERLSRDLILFSNEEKSDWEKYLPAKQSPDPRKLQEKYLPAKQSPDPRKLQEKYLPAKQSPDPRKLQEKLNIIKRWIKPPGGMTPALKETAVTSSKTFLPMEWMRAIKAYALHPASEFGVFVPEPVKRYISQEPINKFKDWISSTPHTVGIFSRSAEEDYSWLQTRLRSDAFQNRVQEVRSCYISSSGFRQFHQDVSQCSFGILYHSKNRGRVNVTDVTDALYNDELRYLSDALGRENVAVLIDDLDDSGPNMRSRILQNQPSIERLAGDLILCDRDKSRNLRTLESLIKATSTRNLVNNEPDIEEPRPSPDKNTQSAQRDQDTQSAQRDRDTLSAQRDQDTQSAQPDQDTQSAQLDQDKQATQLDQDTQSAQSDQDTQSAQLDQDTQSAQRDRDTQSAQPDQDTLSAQPDQDTQSAQPDQDTQSAQLDQDKQATQLDQDTQSAQSDQDTQSAQLDQDTQSAQPDQDTQSAQPDQDTQSAQLDQDTLSAESKQEDSVLVLKQINLLDQQNPAGCSAQHIKVINGAQDGAQYLEKQNISLMDELPRMVYRQSTLHTIGIFSRSAEEDYLWLQTLLGSDRFRDRVQEVRSCYISSSGYRQFYQDVSQCSFGILYHTKIRGRINVTDVTDAVYNDELRYLSDTLGRENVVVLIDDLDDSGPDMRSRILQNQPSIERLSRDLILCDRDKRRNLETIDGLIKALNTLNLATKQEVTSSDSYTIQKTSSSSSSQYGADPGGSLTRGSIKSNPERSDRRHGGGDPSDPPNQAPEGSAPLSGNNSQSHPSRGDQERSKNSRKSNRSSNRREDKAVVSSGNPGGGVRSFLTSVFQTFTQHAAQIFSSTRHTIGIFSRSAEEDYSWLQTRLRSDGFRDWVQEVIPCYISSSGFRQFHQDVSQCSFGILYHTKNRGTINVTDMRGALYDEELRYLSDTLGKQRVVVLIDDLEDSSSDQKIRILQTQPSIARLARNLILINNKRNKESLISPRELFDKI